ncbi:MAG: DUF971 domain-containing protein [Candidatus Zixiibacteriota bacterium]
MTSPTPTPIEIARAHQHDVKIRWNNGRETIFPARFLRLECPCASCIEEMTGRKLLRDDTVAADVHPLSIQPVGRYAIQIQWSDGHNTGLYTWERLWELAERLWQSE